MFPSSGPKKNPLHWLITRRNLLKVLRVPLGLLMEPISKLEFESCVERLPWSGCWIWMRSLGNGYGDFRKNGKHYQAHRYAHELYKGAVGEYHVLHKCDVMGCVNPEHLFLGTNQDNIRDSSLKGRRKGPRYRPSGLKYQRRSATAYDCIRKTTRQQNEQIRQLRSAGMKQRAIAERFGISQPQVHRILHGSG